MRSRLHLSFTTTLAAVLALWLAPAAAGEPLSVFRIERPGLAPSHLIVIPDAHQLTTPARNRIESLFAEAKLLVVEMDLEPTALLPALPAALESDNGHRRNRVDPVLYRRALSLLRAHGIDGQTVSRLRPWALGLALDAPPGNDNLELNLLQQANARRIKVRALESLAERAADLDAIAVADQERMLRAALARGDKAPILLRDLLDAWRAGNGTRLQELLLAAQHEMGPYQSVAHVARLAGRLATLLGDGGALVMVTPQLLDPHSGVIPTLRARGWNVVAEGA